MNLLPLGTLVTYATPKYVSIGMIIGTWSLDSDSQFVDHVGKNPTRDVGDIGYILLVSATGMTRRIFFGDANIGRMVTVASAAMETS